MPNRKTMCWILGISAVVAVAVVFGFYVADHSLWAARALRLLRDGFNGLASLLTWQWVVLLVLLVLLLDPRARLTLSGFSRNVQSVKGFGVEITLNKEITEKTASKISTNLKEAFRGYRQQIDQDALLLADRYQIHPLLGQVVDTTIRAQMSMGVEVRATIHIADPLIANAFYQLIEYYPSYRTRSRGRTLSTRFGMIGLAWRLEDHQVRGDIPRARPGSIEEEVLIRKWGMTRPEALTVGRSRESMICFMLFENQQTRSGRLIGLLYIDAEQPHVFNDERFADASAFRRLEREKQRILLWGIEVELEDFETWDDSDQRRRIAEFAQYNTLIHAIEAKILQIQLPQQVLAVVDKLSEKNLRVDIYDA